MTEWKIYFYVLWWMKNQRKTGTDKLFFKKYETWLFFIIFHSQSWNDFKGNLSELSEYKLRNFYHFSFFALIFLFFILLSSVFRNSVSNWNSIQIMAVMMLDSEAQKDFARLSRNEINSSTFFHSFFLDLFCVSLSLEIFSLLET
jgi:hypothetical protein